MSTDRSFLEPQRLLRRISVLDSGAFFIRVGGKMTRGPLTGGLRQPTYIFLKNYKSAFLWKRWAPSAMLSCDFCNFLSIAHDAGACVSSLCADNDTVNCEV